MNNLWEEKIIEDTKKLLPVLERHVHNEICTRRRLLVAIGVMLDEPPAVQENLVMRLWEIASDAANLGINDAPIGMQDMFRRTKPERLTSA